MSVRLLSQFLLLQKNEAADVLHSVASAASTQPLVHVTDCSRQICYAPCILMSALLQGFLLIGPTLHVAAAFICTIEGLVH